MAIHGLTSRDGIGLTLFVPKRPPAGGGRLLSGGVRRHLAAPLDQSEDRRGHRHRHHHRPRHLHGAAAPIRSARPTRACPALRGAGAGPRQHDLPALRRRRRCHGGACGRGRRAPSARRRRMPTGATASPPSSIRSGTSGRWRRSSAKCSRRRVQRARQHPAHRSGVSTHVPPQPRPSSARTAARPTAAGRASARPAASGTPWSRKATASARAPAGARPRAAQGPAVRARAADRRDARGPAPAVRHRRTRPRHRRRLRARLGAADRRRSRHRQIDPADPGRRRARARRPPRRLYLRRGGGRAGAAARRAARPRRRARSSSPPRPRSRTSSPRCRKARRRASSSSIRSRPCGPTWSNPRPAP